MAASTPIAPCGPRSWGYLQDGKIVPVPPNQVYDITRRALRVRSSFLDEILKPSVSSRQLKELLGDERASDTEKWTTEEQDKVDAAQAEQGRVNFNEKVHAALQAIESDRRVDSAVLRFQRDRSMPVARTRARSRHLTSMTPSDIHGPVADGTQRQACRMVARCRWLHRLPQRRGHDLHLDRRRDWPRARSGRADFDGPPARSRSRINN